MKTIIQNNGLVDGQYVEPYAGGASVGLALLMDHFVSHIHINDLDRAVYAFWYSVLHKTDELCQLISSTPISMDEWYRQRSIQQRPKRASLLQLGFSTFFLNRTNRSGIISGGVIGGKDQSGAWKLDCRFNKTELIERIRSIAAYKKRISLYNEDAFEFMTTRLPGIKEDSLVYFDPPYYVKGKQMLYVNFYQPEDHNSIASLIPNLKQNWIISYDDVPEIRALYGNHKSLSYKLHYTAQDKYQGNEILFFSTDLAIPNIQNPQRTKAPRLAQYQLINK